MNPQEETGQPWEDAALVRWLVQRKPLFSFIFLIAILLPLAIVIGSFFTGKSARFFTEAETDIVVFLPEKTKTTEQPWLLDNFLVTELDWEESDPEQFSSASVFFAPETTLQMRRYSDDLIRIEIVGLDNESGTAFSIQTEDGIKKTFRRGSFISFAPDKSGLTLPFNRNIQIGQEVKPSLSNTPLLRQGSVSIELPSIPWTSIGLYEAQTRLLRRGDMILANGSNTVTAGFVNLVSGAPIFISASIYTQNMIISRYGVNPIPINPSLATRISTNQVLLSVVSLYAAILPFMLWLLARHWKTRPRRQKFAGDVGA